ncbi:MAG: DUF4352 domain-containing protein [Propionibacteriaceae bacterium]|nr:DUF4352 domain-containing protein [Propionibacteriaceae bacterium]
MTSYAVENTAIAELKRHILGVYGAVLGQVWFDTVNCTVMSKILSCIAALVIFGLTLSGCTSGAPQTPAEVITATSVGTPSFSRDLQGFAPDVPEWVFLSVEMAYSAADREQYWLSPTQYRLVSPDAPNEAWLPDRGAMEALPTNSAFFAAAENASGRVTLVFQVPQDYLVGLNLVSGAKDSRTGKPAKSFDLEINEAPQIPDGVGTKPLSRTEVGETVAAGDLEIKVTQVQSTTLINGLAPQYGLKFAVVTIEVAWKGEGTYPLDSIPTAVSIVTAPGQLSQINRLACLVADTKNAFFDAVFLNTGESAKGILVFELMDEPDPYLNVSLTNERTNRLNLNWPTVETTSGIDDAPAPAVIGTAATAKPIQAQVLEPVQVDGKKVKVHLKVTNDSNSPIFPHVYLRLLDGKNKVVKANATGVFNTGLVAAQSVSGWAEFETENAAGSQLLLWNESVGNLARLAIE